MSLLRFLRARKFDVALAKEMFVKYKVSATSSVDDWFLH